MDRSYNIHPISPIIHTYIAYFNFWMLFNINPISTVIVHIHPNNSITYFYFKCTTFPGNESVFVSPSLVITHNIGRLGGVGAGA